MFHKSFILLNYYYEPGATDLLISLAYVFYPHIFTYKHILHRLRGGCNHKLAQIGTNGCAAGGVLTTKKPAATPGRKQRRLGSRAAVSDTWVGRVGHIRDMSWRAVLAALRNYGGLVPPEILGAAVSTRSPGLVSWSKIRGNGCQLYAVDC